ncbi:type IV pilus modification PilV family protein [Rossellomorea sp. LJF3]|uniref:type IV pilus modification PilV family protein n=1 Tax=Rossellomorea sp. LJF3 TaxID=3126099 RepID=UPI00300CD009
MKRNGFTLIEVLVATTLIVIILTTFLGFIRMSYKNTSYNEESLKSFNTSEMVLTYFQEEKKVPVKQDYPDIKLFHITQNTYELTVEGNKLYVVIKFPQAADNSLQDELQNISNLTPVEVNVYSDETLMDETSRSIGFIEVIE